MVSFWLCAATSCCETFRANLFLDVSHILPSAFVDGHDTDPGPLFIRDAAIDPVVMPGTLNTPTKNGDAQPINLKDYGLSNRQASPRSSSYGHDHIRSISTPPIRVRLQHSLDRDQITDIIRRHSKKNFANTLSVASPAVLIPVISHLFAVKTPRYGPHESKVVSKPCQHLENNGLIDDSRDDGPGRFIIVLASKPNQEDIPWNENIWRLFRLIPTLEPSRTTICLPNPPLFEPPSTLS
jgi:hypothetical protein